MKKYKIAAVLMLLHGGLMEVGSGLLTLFPDGLDAETYVSFIVPYFNDHLALAIIMGVVYGTVRVIGAVGLLKNRMWGLALSVINCVVTMALMMFMLPAGIVDGIFACTALVLMLTQYLGDKKIEG